MEYFFILVYISWFVFICFFSARFHTTSRDRSQKTRTLFLRISCLRLSVSTQWITDMRAHCGVSTRFITKTHSCVNKQHTKPLVVQMWLCFYMCVSSPVQQTAPSVCILSIESARCEVLWLAGHRDSLCDCQASLVSRSLIAIISMMRLIF